jgi:hypothetical protein
MTVVMMYVMDSQFHISGKGVHEMNPTTDTTPVNIYPRVVIDSVQLLRSAL